MSRSRLKHGLKGFIKTGARAIHMISGGEVGQTRILTYHSIGSRDHEMNVTPESFGHQMAWLAKHATVIALEDAVAGKSGIALTFDDGYLDNLMNAMPILRQHGFLATVFVVPGRVGRFLDHDTETENARLMSWDEIAELREAGWSIGGHTMSHLHLSALTQEEQTSEIVDSTRVLGERLGETVEAFAYPFGSALDYDAFSIQCVQEAGYAYALSNQYGPVTPKSSRWEVPRIWIDRSDTIETFAQKVCGELDGLSILDRGWAIRLRRFVNRFVDAS